jgi:hypothetical protein
MARSGWWPMGHDEITHLLPEGIIRTAESQFHRTILKPAFPCHPKTGCGAKSSDNPITD